MYPEDNSFKLLHILISKGIIYIQLHYTLYAYAMPVS